MEHSDANRERLMRAARELMAVRTDLERQISKVEAHLSEAEEGDEADLEDELEVLSEAFAEVQEALDTIDRV